ncbi:MAG: hypothetical protein RR075_06355, partial [Pygmaiobacter sp.]
SCEAEDVPLAAAEDAVLVVAPEPQALNAMAITSATDSVANNLFFIVSSIKFLVLFIQSRRL